MDSPPWSDEPTGPAGPPAHVPPPDAPAPPLLERIRPQLQSGLNVGIVVTLVFWLTGALLAGRPPGPASLDSSLRAEPAQTPTSAAPFSFDYAGRTYQIEPVADYVLHGLVMSRNNPKSMADAYHDSRSVDTRDLCVVWGPNLQIPLHRVSVHNSSWTCWVKWPAGVDFDMTALSNNHLITDSDAVRAQIEAVRPGDQVRVEGLLVNYFPEDQPTWRRTTSTRRDDDGNTACEVVFVDSIEVLRVGTPVPYALAGIGKWGLALVLLLQVGLFGARVARDAGVLPRD